MQRVGIDTKGPSPGLTGRRYGQWAGNPDGQPEKPGYCTEKVYPTGSFINRQCSKKAKYGPSDEYCKIHAKRHGGS